MPSPCCAHRRLAQHCLCNAMQYCGTLLPSQALQSLAKHRRCCGWPCITLLRLCCAPQRLTLPCLCIAMLGTALPLPGYALLSHTLPRGASPLHGNAQPSFADAEQLLSYASLRLATPSPGRAPPRNAIHTRALPLLCQAGHCFALHSFAVAEPNPALSHFAFAELSGATRRDASAVHHAAWHGFAFAERWAALQIFALPCLCSALRCMALPCLRTGPILFVADAT